MSKDYYNIAIECVDKHGQCMSTNHKTAMVYIEDADLKEGHDFEHINFAALKVWTNRTASIMASIGLKKGDRILVRCDNRPEFAFAFLGAIKAGIVPIPVSPLLVEEELLFLMQDSGAKALFTEEAYCPQKWMQAKPASLESIVLMFPEGPHLPEGVYCWEELLMYGSDDFFVEETLADEPAFWLYTSGTQGKPKAVIHAHRSIRAHAGRMKSWQNLKNEDYVFNTGALNWSYSLTCSLLDLWSGGFTTIIYNGKPDVTTVLSIIERACVTVLMSVPTYYRRLARELNNNDERIKKLRVCLSAGEKLPDIVRESFSNKTGLVIYEGLGMTEHSVYIAQPFGEKIVKNSSGKAIEGVRIAILDESLKPLPHGQVGMLASHLSSEGLMLSYHQRPEELRSAFRGEWFLSGDMAAMDEQGNIFFEGRKDDVVNAGGYRISPLEVEGVLNRHEQVEESAVVGLALEEGKTILKAFVVSKENSSLTDEGLKSFCKQHLASYKCPREIEFIEKLPKTNNGKIKRKDLLSH